MKNFICPIGQEDITKIFYKEIVLENEYSRFDIKVKSGDIVLDCGAFVGIFTQDALDKGASYVYSFECNPDHYKCLKQNITSSNATLILGYITDRYEVEHYNFDRILKEFNLTHIDFAKIDIEGWEYPLLLNMPDDTMKKINKWAIEFHMFDWNNNPEYLQKMLSIIEKFSKNGFRINYEHIHKEWNVSMMYAIKI